MGFNSGFKRLTKIRLLVQTRGNIVFSKYKHNGGRVSSNPAS